MSENSALERFFQDFCRVTTNSCLASRPKRVFLQTAALHRHGENAFSLKEVFSEAAAEIHAFPNNDDNLGPWRVQAKL